MSNCTPWLNMLNHINIFLHYNILGTEKVYLSTNDIFDHEKMPFLLDWENTFNEDIHSIIDLCANLKHHPTVQNIHQSNDAIQSIQ